MCPLKPSNKEDEYFAKQEAIKLRKLALKHKEQMSKEETKKLKELHWMHCPKCGHEMQEITINNVQVDKCFICGGLFLDAGELEKISGRQEGFFKSMDKVFEES